MVYIFIVHSSSISFTLPPLTSHKSTLLTCLTPVAGGKNALSISVHHVRPNNSSRLANETKEENEEIICQH